MHEGREKVFYIPGKKRELLVAAPHHGYIPGSDYYTKEFAALLAIKLDGHHAENLVSLVDLNKTPTRFNATANGALLHPSATCSSARWSLRFMDMSTDTRI